MLIRIIRWLLLIPAIVIAVIAAGFLTNLLVWLGQWMTGYNPDAPLHHFLRNVIVGLTTGFLTVRLAIVAVPPRLLLGVTAVATSVGFLAAIVVVAAVATQDLWAMIQATCLAVGAGVARAQARSGELVEAV